MSCCSWFRKSGSSLPKPLKPSGQHSQLRRRTNGTTSTADWIAELKEERKSYKNISIYITELPPTPTRFRDKYHRGYIPQISRLVPLPNPVCRDRPWSHSHQGSTTEQRQLDIDDFGVFTLKNLPVLEKANKEVIQKLRAEAVAAQNKSRSNTTMSPRPLVTINDYRRMNWRQYYGDPLRGKMDSKQEELHIPEGTTRGFDRRLQTVQMLHIPRPQTPSRRRPGTHNSLPHFPGPQALIQDHNSDLPTYRPRQPSNLDEEL